MTNGERNREIGLETGLEEDLLWKAIREIEKCII
jgi:hypothetical protein